MAIDAHHCPGAVMFLFRGEFGCLLFTGDFSWETASKRAKIGRTMLLDALKDDVVDILYLDNTYCNPSYIFPSREAAAQQIWPERLRTMHFFGFHDIFTTKTSLTRVRAVPRYSFNVETLEGLNTMRPTIGIMPSGLPWVTKSLGRGSVGRFHKYIYTVPYSDHSCFAEIEDFIKLVQPTSMKGIVSSSSCYVDPLYYFGWLCGANQPVQRSLHKHKRKKRDERVPADRTAFSSGGASAESERK